MNENMRARLLLFFVGFPLLILSLFFLQFANYIVISGILLIVQFLSSKELRNMLTRASLPDTGDLATFIGLIPSVLTFISCILYGSLLETAFVLFISWSFCLMLLLIPLVFQKKNSFPDLIKQAASIALVHCYTALLPGFLIFIVSGFPNSQNTIISFALLTFGNDSLAWFFGKYLARKRNLLDVSPNKSISGFIGGTIGSIVAAFIGLGPIAGAWKPSGIAYILLSLSLGLGMAFFVIVGDLFESALKRSAGIKDSGSIVPGRGGILDSFDSLYFSAPFFIAFSYTFHLFNL
ncbi:MAG TPA: phosphatidate cytidylyltransferase [Rectinema sp.]|nr:phosphatidate cytidylyltransferase [Spirochaetia bacterium]MDI9427802.1 phosphatidate cytidylyltransferase [Spirochaetota bacterium]OQC75091.1 MAG: Phosphatidate cytidylyltransferase [Spirochaetes bacterium ADurb.Bin001]HNT58620.1 phosphatidate cytidylyltransferase [Rectinema sp.]HNV35397.1 phosphatidate cytidylyltransferase [Rectinema sp.]